MISGYSEHFRLEVIQSPVRGFEKQWERADKGITPLHRPCEFQAEQRWKKKHMNKTSWYNAVLFIQATPGGILAKNVQAMVNEEAPRIGMSVKVVEKGGTSPKQHLVKTDLTGCIYHKQPKHPCFLCEAGVKGGSHTKSDVHYSGLLPNTFSFFIQTGLGILQCSNLRWNLLSQNIWKDKSLSLQIPMQIMLWTI